MPIQPRLYVIPKMTPEKREEKRCEDCNEILTADHDEYHGQTKTRDGGDI